MDEIFLIHSQGPTSLCQEFSDLHEAFETTFFKNPDGSTKLAVRLTEGQDAYRKMIRIGAATYPDDKSCMMAVLNGLTAYEYVMANLILMEGGDGDE